MRKIVTTIGVGLIMALITPVVAQDKKSPVKKEHQKEMTPEDVAKKRTDKMTKELGLSKEQHEKVYQINLEHAKKMDELRKQKKAQKEKTKAEMDKVLTDEQKKKAAELRKERKEKHHPHHHED